jgi:hypothetical protein
MKCPTSNTSVNCLQDGVVDINDEILVDIVIGIAIGNSESYLICTLASYQI